MRPNRFQELDIVRGFAACWVIGIHFWYIHVIPLFMGFTDFFEYIKVIGTAYSTQKFFPVPPSTLGNLLFDLLNVFFLLGYQGVHLFFVLSGFSLTYSELLKPQKSWSSFIQNKFIRIYPTYWILLILSLAIPWTKSALFFGYFDSLSLWRSFLLLDKAIPYSWFMFPLIQFYLAFSILFRLLSRWGEKRFLINAFLLKFFYTFFVLTLGYSFFPHLVGDGAYPGYIAISRLFEFSLGMTFARIYITDPERLISFLTSFKVILLAFFCELIGILCSFEFPNSFTISNVVLPLGISIYDAFIGFGIFIIICNLARLIIRFTPQFKAFLLFTSKISYELYLVQFVGLLLVSKLILLFVPKESPITTALRAVLLYPLTIAICIVAALLLRFVTTLASTWFAELLANLRARST